MSRIIVVCGLFINEDKKVLMTLRPHDVIPPDRWECPGGKVEPGETLEEALVREMSEELGVKVGVRYLVSSHAFTWDERMHMLLFRCDILEGTPQPLVSQEIRWVEIRNARQKLPMLPAQYCWYPDIVEEVNRG